MPTIRETGDTILLAISNFMSFLPTLLGAVLILILGWILSSIFAKLLEKGLLAVGFERAVERGGLKSFISRSGASWTTSRLIANLLKWFVRLLFVQAAANLLQMPQVTATINSIVLFIPNMIVAVVILVIGSMIAQFLAGLVRSSLSNSGIANPEWVARTTQYAIIAFSVIAAVNQLGIATTVVNTLFIGLIASFALAMGLAFGLGGRDVAARITQNWYDSGRRAIERRAERIESEQARLVSDKRYGT